MTDLYFTEDGDIATSPVGDIALTPAQWRDDVQQAYIRLMTDVGDYVMYPTLGADLSRLWGMPQSNTTGDFGVDLIESALEREGRFVGKPFTVKAVPTDYHKIRFDVFIKNGSKEKIRLSVEQDLGVV